MNNSGQLKLWRLAVAIGAAASAHSSIAQTVPALPISPTPVTNYEYDAEGNPTKTVQAPGGLNLTTQASYDKLGRVKDSTDAKAGLTQYGYDGLDRTTQVKDPRNLATQYPRNGLGDPKQVVSPDTGTANMTYDSAGNLKTRTDSRGALATYTYDALNRLTAAVYTQSGKTTINQAWTYDRTDVPNGIGRLGTVNFPAGSLSITYDARGRVISHKQQLTAATGANSATLTHTVNYGYTQGQLTSITYPSGRKLTVTYTGGVPTALALAKDTSAGGVPLITGIQWEPFGPAKHWDWQMASGAQANDRVYDTFGRLVRYRLGGSLRDLSYDTADRISSYKHYDAATGAAQPALDQSFSYDELGRLTHTTLYAGYWDFQYDANGNRTSATVNGNTNAYTISATSNRVTSISNPTRNFAYDNAGNTTADGYYSGTYDLSGRLATLTKAGVTATYSYDPQGRRLRKFDSTGAGSTMVFVYDLEDHLLGEYDSTGKALREYVWLGDTPIAVFTPDPASATNPPLVSFIHTDHLNAPRLVVDKNNNVRWRWLADPFGSAAAETNPSGLGAFTFNLRFPGQYFDQESGLFYNRWRYYSAADGRYAQSDPVGLLGGVNTYAYVSSNPLLYFDPNGLWAWGDPLPQGLVDFSAGFGDSMSFGLSSLIRSGLDIGSVDKCSGYYRGGETADIVFETFTLGLSAGMKGMAARASRSGARNAARPSIDAFREAGNLEGGFVHHSNPLFGHPGGFPTTFPTGGLPSWMHSNSMNLRWFADSASHSAAHRWMRRLEGGWDAFVNPATTAVRAARDIAGDACTCE